METVIRNGTWIDVIKDNEGYTLSFRGDCGNTLCIIDISEKRMKALLKQIAKIE